MRKIVIIPSSFVILLVFITSCAQSKELKISVEEYQDKVYASWLAQCIGNIYGLPHENKYIDEPGPETFPYGYSEDDERLKEANGAFSDDDTDIEYMYLLSMEKYGSEPTYEQLANSWKYHVRDRVWLANRAALGAMHYGFTPPVTGMKDYNPHWFQIDPQLVNEVWAVTAPGMVDYAAAKSGWAARITDDDWGIEPTIHYGAMYSAAFFESDIHKLIDIGTAALPEGSRFAQTVEEMKALYKKYPNDWKQARKEMAEKYYHNEPIDTKTIWNANLNGACGILALLYGEGDFQKTLDLSCAIGFDADNQAATMSGLLGVVHGTKGLPKNLLFPFPDLNWKEPFNDLYKNITRHDMPDASLKDMAARMVKQGEKIILMKEGRKVTENGKDFYIINPDAQFSAPLEFPGAPMPIIEVGKKVNYNFLVSSSNQTLKWRVLKGKFPKGIRFENGKITGVATIPGIYRVKLQIQQGDKKSSREFKLVVRAQNLAPTATKVLANVKDTDTKTRDAMWLTVSRSLYSDRLDDIIRDGKVTGDGSTFYSINDSPKPKKDYYGYEWTQPQTVGLLGVHTGSMEENGGWFTSLNVQYRNNNGTWVSVEGLVISPSLVKGDKPHNKPHFVEYLLVFKPVRTTAIRIIGDAGGSKHWYSKPAYFTSISELSAHGPLPNFENLAE
ncbi:hypothetical protein ES703_70775 [subsurface metagenome]